MTHITLAGCEPHTLLSHMAMYGLGAILEAEGAPSVRIGWKGTANPRPYVSTGAIDAAGLLQRHAESQNGSWLREDIDLKGTPRGLMSPRLTPFGDRETWARVQQARMAVLDKLTDQTRWLDLRFLAALGEPCYWSSSQKNESLQDDGASRLEMQPRNTGSELVGSRLRKLAAKVAARSPGEILAGLQGSFVIDEIGNNSPDSRTPTGLASPGPADNAIAWCALWGISQFPIAMRAGGTAVTSGHIGRTRNEWFYVPMWKGSWRPARLRSVIASRPLRVLAAVKRPQFPVADARLGLYPEEDVAAARAWLEARDVEGIVRFPIQRFGSDSAPERRAMRGELIPVRVAP